MPDMRDSREQQRQSVLMSKRRAVLIP
jgi:hypothetical protein